MIGFLCEDGVVLCADRQITYPKGHKYYEIKIYVHEWDDYPCVIAFTFSGNPTLMRMFNGKFEAAMQVVINGKVPPSIYLVQEQVETVLGLMDVAESDDEGLFMLCAIATPGPTWGLLKTERKAVSSVRLFDYVGAGDSSVVRYLEPIMTRLRTCTTMQALNIGTYLVWQAKKYVDGCGGETDAVVLDNRTIAHQFWGRHDREIDLAGIENAVGIVATLFLDTRCPDEQFIKVLENLVAKLKNDRRELLKRLC
jgi:hypothetical protein